MKELIRASKLLIALAAVLVTVAGCAGAGQQGVASTQGGEGQMPETLVVGLIPSENNQEMLRQFDPMIKYLEKKLGTKVKAYTATDYSGIIEAMRSDKVDVALFGPLSYVLASEVAGAESIAVAFKKEGEEPTYRSLIVTQANSDIKSVKDLKGKTFSFVDPASTSGYLYARKMLIDGGIDPDKDLAGSRFAGGHDASLLAVQNGSVNAGAVWDGQYEKMVKAGAVSEDKVRIVTRSEPIPKDPVAVRKNLPPEVKQRIKDAFLTMTPQELGGTSVDGAGAIGYKEAPDKNYDTIRDLVKMLNLDLKKLGAK